MLRFPPSPRLRRDRSLRMTKSIFDASFRMTGLLLDVVFRMTVSLLNVFTRKDTLLGLFRMTVSLFNVCTGFVTLSPDLSGRRVWQLIEPYWIAPIALLFKYIILQRFIFKVMGEFFERTAGAFGFGFAEIFSNLNQKCVIFIE